MPRRTSCRTSCWTAVGPLDTAGAEVAEGGSATSFGRRRRTRRIAAADQIGQIGGGAIRIHDDRNGAWSPTPTGSGAVRRPAGKRFVVRRAGRARRATRFRSSLLTYNSCSSCGPHAPRRRGALGTQRARELGARRWCSPLACVPDPDPSPPARRRSCPR